MKEVFGLTAAAFCGTAILAGDIDPGLEHVLNQTNPGDVVSALVYLNDQFDAKSFNELMNRRQTPLATRHNYVVTDLRDTAARTQGPIVNALTNLRDQGRVADFEAYWVANMIRVDAVPAELELLAQRNDVKVMYFNYPIENIDPVHQGEVTGQKTALAPEPGIDAVRAPEVWNDFGIDGTGVLVATLDTGVDGNHPALASRWRGLDPRYSNNPEWAFFDPVTNWQFPRDSGSHGTHTMGSVLGGAPGDQIGVAPGAEWIHAAVIDRVSIQRTVADALLAFQWCIDPDGNASTHWDVPTSCSNSWGLVTGHGYPPCDETFWSVIDNCEAAGIVVIFSAGNEGSSGLRRPADRASNEYNCMAVASVNANLNGWPISWFSSRGPTFCTPGGEAAIKPDVSAPGEDVRSSVPGNGYSSFSGTSMASPHINGVVAMMRQANPDLPVDDIKQIIYDTAFDLGSSGEDNSYGWGMVDAYEAVSEAIRLRSCMALRVDNLVANDTATFTVRNNISQGDRVVLVWGTGGNGTVWNDQNGYCATFEFDVLTEDQILAEGVVNANDEFVADVPISYELANEELMFQAAKFGTCPDECMSHVLTRTVGVPAPCMNLEVENLVSGQTATFTVSESIQRGDYVTILWGLGGEPTTLNGLDYCTTFWFEVTGQQAFHRIVGQGYVDKNKEFVTQVNVPSGLSGLDIMFQAAKRGTCPEECMSNFVDTTVQ